MQELEGALYLEDEKEKEGKNAEVNRRQGMAYLKRTSIERGGKLTYVGKRGA